MGYSIRFDQKIVGTTLDRTFSVIEDWLKTNGGKIKGDLRPQFIEASHGRSLQPIGWRKDAKKTMRFELLQQGSEVLVTVNISPSGLNASDVKSREDEARANWNQLLAELWSRFGETGSPTVSETRPVDWSRSLSKANTSIIAGVFCLVIGFVASILNTEIFIVTLVIGVLLVTNGAMSRRSAKKRMGLEASK